MDGHSRYPEAKAFRDTFHPLTKRFTIRDQAQQDLDGSAPWYTMDRNLSNRLITDAIMERLAVGFYVTHTPNVVGMDIDAHQGQGLWWSTSIYNQVVECMGVTPSMLVRSPRGLHAFWLLTERIPASVLIEATRERIGNLAAPRGPVEIKPTPTTALRIPAQNHVMDPVTMQPLNVPFVSLLAHLTAYHPAMILGDEVLPDEIRTRLQNTLETRKAQSRILKALPRIEQVEAREIPLENGRTNDSFLRLCLAYRMAGLDVDQAVYRFVVVLANSPNYTGDLRNTQRLYKRVATEYSRNADYTPRPKVIQPVLFDEPLIRDLVAVHPFAKQRTRPVEAFLTRLFTWCAWHDEILQDKGQTALFDFLYKYYRKNRKEGLYPLPRTVLRKWNGHPDDLIRWLQRVEVVGEAPYGYSARDNIALYYPVKRELRYILNNRSAG